MKFICSLPSVQTVRKRGLKVRCVHLCNSSYSLGTVTTSSDARNCDLPRYIQQVSISYSEAPGFYNGSVPSKWYNEYDHPFH